MAQAIAYALSALIVAFFVWLRPDSDLTPDGPPWKNASIVGRAIALVFVVPMILLGLGNLAGSAYGVAVHGKPSFSLGVDRAEMREIMLSGEMAPFWQLVDQKASADIDYIIDRIFAGEQSYTSEEDVMNKLNKELLNYRVQMAIYGPALTDSQRSILIRSQSDFLRAFQEDPKTCAAVAMQGGAALSPQQLSSVSAVFNRTMTTMMGLLIDAKAAARDGAAMPKPPSEDDYALLVGSMIESGTTEHELQVLFSEQSDDPAFCKVTLAFMDAVADLATPSGAAVRFEIVQSLLTAQ